MNILLAVDGSPYTRRMLAHVAENDECDALTRQAQAGVVRRRLAGQHQVEPVQCKVGEQGFELALEAHQAQPRCGQHRGEQDLRYELGESVGHADGQVRLDLLGTEIEEQKLRALAALLWAAAGVALLGVGLAVLAAAVLATFWDSARGAAFAALLVVYLGAGAWALWRARCSLRTPAGAFAASAGELARDRSALSCASVAPSGERPR